MTMFDRKLDIPIMELKNDKLINSLYRLFSWNKN